MKDVRDNVQNNPNISDSTKKDYIAQIDRCLKAFNANDIADISANILVFRTRFKKTDFPHEHFKTVKAYLAWRKKMVSILKRAAGIAAVDQERRQRDDGWAELREEWMVIHPGENSGLISISWLADEARKAGLLPKDMNIEWLVELINSLSLGRRRAIRAQRSRWLPVLELP